MNEFLQKNNPRKLFRLRTTLPTKIFILSTAFVLLALGVAAAFGNAVFVIVPTALAVGFLTQLFVRLALNKSLRRIIEVDIYSDEDVYNFMTRDDNKNTKGDAIGTLYKHFYEILSAISNFQSDIFTMSTWHMAGQYDYRIDASKYKGYHRRLIKNINAFTESYVTSFTELLDVVGKYGEGDFTANVSTYPENWLWANKKVDDLRQTFIQITSEIDALLESASQGDLNMRIDQGKYGGNWADVAVKLNNLMDAVARPLNEITHNVTIMSHGDFTHLDGTYPGVFGELQHACNMVNNTTSSIVDEISKVLKAISEGDLTVGLKCEYPGSYAPIESALTTILQSLNNTMKDVARVADGVSDSSVYLSKNAELLSSDSSTHLTSMQNLTAGIKDIDSRSKSNTKNAKKAAEIVQASKDRAAQSKQVMQHLLGSMKEIDSSSRKISEITKVIENIAFQISLLSLNASIEAARAGAHGMGFSVVAEEVRALASKSDDASKKSADVIKESRTSVEKGIEQVSLMDGSLQKIVEDIMGISDLMDDIQKSSTQQSEAISSINTSMTELGSVTQRAADASVDTSQAAAELDAEIEFLRQKLSFFKTNMQTLPSSSDVYKNNTVGSIANINKLMHVGHSQVKFDAGDIVIQEGDDESQSMYVVLEGVIEVYKNHGAPNQILLATLEPGSIIGEMALFLKEPRTATIVAKTNAKLIEIKQDNMHSFIDENPDIAYTMIETLCLRLNNLLKRLNV